MNKLLTGAVGAASLAMILTGCSDTFDPSSTSDREGTLIVSVDLDKEVAAPRAMSKASAEADAIEASDLSLRLTAANGQQWSWNSYTEMEPASYSVGSYTLEAFYGDINEEGFEKPHYYGSQEISVLENKATTVSLTATLANAMITVACSDEAQAYFSSIELSVASATGATHAYALDETRPLYIAPGATSVSAAVVLQDGTRATLNPVAFEAKARNSYAVAFTVNGGETGKAQLNVSFSDALVDETIEIDLSSELLSAPAPTVATEGFTSGDRIAIVEGTPFATPLRAIISAHAGVGTAVMTTSSASLLSQGWPAVVDFATADAATLATLTRLGLKYEGLTGTRSRMARIDFTDVASHIGYNESGNNLTEITLIAKDAVTKESEPISISFDVEKLTLEIASYELDPSENRLALDVTYNGGDLAEAIEAGDVRFRILNDRGTYDVVTPLSVSAAARAAATYTVVLPTPEEGDVIFKAEYNNIETEIYTAERRDLDAQVVVNANDVFAWQASISLTGSEADAQAARVFVSDNGGVSYNEVTATNNGGLLTFTGLKAATDYSVRVRINGLTSKATAFTTEAAGQLPNEWDTDEWYRVNGKSNYWWIEYPGKDENTVWGTMNLLTTSQGGSTAAPGASYSAFSGTRQTTDTHSATSGYAAVISTVGWGSGNTAWLGTIGSGLSGGKCNHLTVGELYLGHYDSATQKAVYDGLAFSSRPSGLTFYHKYTKRNSADWGVAEIKVLDASGNTIASGDARLEAESYTETHIALSYGASAAKASKIVVAFRSSGNPDCQTVSNANLSSPPSGNLSTGRYTGSELYIDDIVLNY